MRLRWSPVENAAGYRIYRNRYQPTALNELGLPLGIAGAVPRLATRTPWLWNLACTGTA